MHFCLVVAHKTILCPECERTPFACISMAWMSLVSPAYHTYTTFAPDCIDTPCPVMLAKYLLVRLISCFYLFFLFTCCLHVSFFPLFSCFFRDSRQCLLKFSGLHKALGLSDHSFTCLAPKLLLCRRFLGDLCGSHWSKSRVLGFTHPIIPCFFIIITL
jgi:hypothetical protein